jgi:uncharacterized coiled-coil DUF342 family protein
MDPNIQKVIDEQKELISLFKEAVDNRDTIISNLKDTMKSSHEILSSIVLSYSTLSSRFALELNKPIERLKDKAEDIQYVKEFMETYMSILGDVNDLLQRVTLVAESSLKIQTSIED